MTEDEIKVTRYTIENRVEFDRSAFEVDGVEIITCREIEAMQAHALRMCERMEREISDAIMYGDGPRPKLLK